MRCIQTVRLARRQSQDTVVGRTWISAAVPIAGGEIEMAVRPHYDRANATEVFLEECVITHDAIPNFILIDRFDHDAPELVAAQCCHEDVVLPRADRTVVESEARRRDPRIP